MAGGHRSGTVKAVRAVYDKHESFKAAPGGYRDVELNWLKGYIGSHAGSAAGQLTLGGGSSAISVTQLPVEILKPVSRGNCVYFSWLCSSKRAGHAIAAAPGGGGRFSFFEPNYGIYTYSGTTDFIQFGLELAGIFGDYGVDQIDRFDWIAFRA